MHAVAVGSGNSSQKCGSRLRATSNQLETLLPIPLRPVGSPRSLTRQTASNQLDFNDMSDSVLYFNRLTDIERSARRSFNTSGLYKHVEVYGQSAARRLESFFDWKPHYMTILTL